MARSITATAADPNNWHCQLAAGTWRLAPGAWQVQANKQGFASSVCCHLREKKPLCESNKQGLVRRMCWHLRGERPFCEYTKQGFVSNEFLLVSTFPAPSTRPKNHILPSIAIHILNQRTKGGGQLSEGRQWAKHEVTLPVIDQ